MEILQILTLLVLTQFSLNGLVVADPKPDWAMCRRSRTALPMSQGEIDRQEQQAEEIATKLLKSPGQEIEPLLKPLNAIGERELLYQLIAAMSRKERFTTDAPNLPPRIETRASESLGRLWQYLADPQSHSSTDPGAIVPFALASGLKDAPTETVLEAHKLGLSVKSDEITSAVYEEVLARKDPELAEAHFSRYSWPDPLKDPEAVQKMGQRTKKYLSDIYNIVAKKPDHLPMELPALAYLTGDAEQKKKVVEKLGGGELRGVSNHLLDVLASAKPDRKIASELLSLLAKPYEQDGRRLSDNLDPDRFDKAIEKHEGRPAVETLRGTMVNGAKPLAERMGAADYLESTHVNTDSEKRMLADELKKLLPAVAKIGALKPRFMQMLLKNKVSLNTIEPTALRDSTLEKLLSSDSEDLQVAALKSLNEAPNAKFAPKLIELFALPRPKFQARIAGEAIPGAARDHELSAILPKLPAETMRPFLSQLRTMVTDQKYEDKKPVLIRTLAGLKDSGSMDLFLEHCLKPKDDNSNGKTNFDQLNSCKAIAGILTDKPELNTGALKNKIDHLLASNDPKLDVAQRVFRKFLNADVKAAANKERASKAIKENKLSENLCDHICGLASKVPQWADDRSLAIKESYWDSTQPAYTYELARKSLGFLFLEKASKFCGAETQKTAKELEEKWFHQMVTDRIAPPGKKDGEESYEKLLDQAIGKKEADRVRQSMADRMSEDSHKNAEPQNSAEIYARLFYSRLLHSVSEGADIEANLREAKEKTNQGLQKNLVKHHNKKYEQLKEKEDPGTFLEHNGNSVMTTYLFAAGVLQTEFERPDLQKEAVDRLKGARDDAIRLDGDANAISYYLQRRLRSDPDKGQTRLEEDHSKRDGAARAVPTHLAIFLKDSDPAAFDTNRAYLSGAVRNYLDHFYEIFSGIGDSRTHDDYDEGMAPYYGPSTVAYVADAIRVLEKTASTPEEKTKLKAMRSELSQYVISMMGKDGLFKPQNKEFYPGAKSYDNALVGLAMVSMLDFDKDSCPAAPKPVGPLVLTDESQIASAVAHSKKAGSHN